MSLEATLDHFIKEQETGFRELRERSEETDKQIKETDKIVKNYIKMNESRWGRFVESLVAPSVLDLFNKCGIKVNHTSRNHIVEDDNGRKIFEVDILMVNTDTIVLIEVKTTLTVDDVKVHINRRLNNVKKYFSHYHDCKVYGGVAYINIDSEADIYAMKKGLFVLSLTGDNLIEIKNEKEFVPVDFG